MITTTTSMTIGEFREMIDDMTRERMGLTPFCDFLRQETDDDKLLREEYLAILAAIEYTGIADDEEIKLGYKTPRPDAETTSGHLFEVVQALPEDEHTIRIEIASGGATPVTYWKHATDHHQFPESIIKAIELKHDKRYAGHPSLIVALDGDYSFDDDRMVIKWIETIRERTTRGTFKEILLFERARRKIFPLFDADK